MALDDLLRRLNAGEFDGGLSIGKNIVLEINDGIPQKTYNGKTVDVFDGKEHSRTNTSETTRYETDEEKKEFIQKYGFNNKLFYGDEDAEIVSKNYYENRNK